MAWFSENPLGSFYALLFVAKITQIFVPEFFLSVFYRLVLFLGGDFGDIFMQKANELRET
jgi:hypothetical protein